MVFLSWLHGRVEIWYSALVLALVCIIREPVVNFEYYILCFEPLLLL